MRLEDDDFLLFGLPQQFAQSVTEIDARWKALQAKVHPDKFAADSAHAQRLAMQWALRVNEAQRRLRDPMARAAYLCELRGAVIDAQRNTAMPRAFLMQQMQWRESLEAAVELAQVESLDAQIEAEQANLVSLIAVQLDELNQPEMAAQGVRALMFLKRFRQDISQRLDALGQ